MQTIDDIEKEQWGSFGDATARMFSERATKLRFYTGTPIERLMGCALYQWACTFNVVGGPKPLATFYDDAGQNLDSVMAKGAKDYLPLSIWHQMKVGKYSADFLVRFGPHKAPPKWIAIECDGHAYHERTKEQAEHDRARDRAFQHKGLAIFRFTGSEIWRDPSNCVEEVFQFCRKDG